MAEEKGWFDKVADKSKSAFKVAKDSSLGKGFISAYNNVIGKEFGMIDGGTPDGVHSGTRSKGKGLKAPIKPDQTKARAVKTDSEFMHGYTLGLLHGAGHDVLYANHNVYKQEGSPEEVTSIQTFYESQYLEQDKPITYIRFKIK